MDPCLKGHGDSRYPSQIVLKGNPKKRPSTHLTPSRSPTGAGASLAHRVQHGGDLLMLPGTRKRAQRRLVDQHVGRVPGTKHLLTAAKMAVVKNRVTPKWLALVN